MFANPAVGDVVVIRARKCHGEKAVVKETRYSGMIFLLQLADGSLAELYRWQFWF